MKTSFRLVSILGAIIFLGVNIFYGNANGKGKNMKEYFYVENGKMMFSREGVNSIVGKTITFKNGTKCKKNGECLLINGSSFRLGNAQRMDASGFVYKNKRNKAVSKKRKNNTVILQRTSSKTAGATYFCPDHLDVDSGEEGHCGRCGKALMQILEMKKKREMPNNTRLAGD